MLTKDTGAWRLILTRDFQPVERIHCITFQHLRKIDTLYHLS